MKIKTTLSKNLLKIFLFLLFLLPLTTSAYTSFPTKIDTLQERINIQVVLNKVMNPSPNLVVDGVIGRKSIQAIQSFQESRGLVPDGKVGPITRNALETSQTGTTTPTETATNTPTPTNTNTTNTPPTTTTSSSNTNTSTASTKICAAGAIYNAMTGELCTKVTTSLTLSCTSSTKYSPVTGVYCGNTTTTNTSTTNYCTGSSTQSCIIGNGSGTVSSCNNGYQISGNTCVVIPSTPTAPTKIINVTASGYEFGTNNFSRNTLDGDLNITSRWSMEGDNEWISYELNQ